MSLNLEPRASEPVSRPAADPVEQYVADLTRGVATLPEAERSAVIEQARARLEIELEIASATTPEQRLAVVERMGDPAQLAAQFARAESPLIPCRACLKDVSREAERCPACGAPSPALQTEPPAVGTHIARGRDWRTKKELFGLPLVHICYGRDEHGKLRTAKGIIAIGQFARGGIVIAQFGVGAVFGLGQVVAAPIAIGQVAFGLIAIGQFGLGLLLGVGMFATGLNAFWFRPPR